ncbi:MAG: hypothetical protein ACK4TL_02100 [Hyphomicrobiaceae bacterium]
MDPRLYWLVEHLDAALAAGDQLMSLTLEITEPTPQMGPRRLRTRVARFIRFVNQVRGLEASLIAHVLQARRRVAELPRGRGPLRLLLDPFTSGTTVLLDAVAEYGDPAGSAFNTGADRLAYLRARGLIAGDSGALMPIMTFEVGENFRVAGRIELGPLLDLVESFLNALNIEFGIWNDTTDDLAPANDTDETASLGEQIANVRALLVGGKADASGAAAYEPAPKPGSLAAALAEMRASRSPAE